MSLKGLIIKVPYVLLIFILASNYQLVWCQNRIVGGSEIPIRNVPYMLQLKFPAHHKFCSAAIIGKKWGLTAAHCFNSAEPGHEPIVVGGNDDIKHPKNTTKNYRVTKYYVHEGYNRTARVGNDIAVFKVNRPFVFNEAMQPVKLPKKGEHVETSWGHVAGWGYKKPKGTRSSKLMYVELPKIPFKTCKKTYARIGIPIRNGTICYGYLDQEVNKATCQGDSGGPLVNRQSIAIGIVSWGKHCGEYPGVYTEITYFRDWIRDKTGI